MKKWGHYLLNQEPCPYEPQYSVPAIEAGKTGQHITFGEFPVAFSIASPASQVTYSPENGIREQKFPVVFNASTNFHYSL